MPLSVSSFASKLAAKRLIFSVLVRLHTRLPAYREYAGTICLHVLNFGFRSIRFMGV